MLPDVIQYQLEYPDGESDRIALKLELEGDHALNVPESFRAPDWALLTHHQCSNCPLDADEHKYCPVARNLAWVFSGTQPRQSHEQVRLRVTTPQRAYGLNTTVQRALSSLFGLVCALSNCPHTRALRPMGVFHLPVATEIESLARVASFFLLKSWLKDRRQGGDGRADLEELEETYRNLNILNRQFVKRVRDVGRTDAAVNALILLDTLAKDVTFELDSQLEVLNDVFHPAPEPGMSVKETFT